MAGVTIEGLLNHELDPSTKAMACSLSGGRSVGAFVATKRIDGRKAVCVVPIGAVELMDHPEVIALATKQAATAFAEMAA